KKVAIDATASIQRARISLRVLEDSLSSAELFVRNAQYYGFVAENGSDASLSFVARLAKSFPRSGKFGDLDVRRLTFSLEAGSDSSLNLVLRQNPVMMDLDPDEQASPLVLAKGVKDFQMQFWDAQQNDWTDQWDNTNSLPRLVMVTLRLGNNPGSSQAQEDITKIISIASVPVQPGWQPTMPMAPGIPGGNPNGIGQPPANVPQK
ncbi:MAG TPA: type II secretion system protein GspJ, partial [Verrucomicrobiae bacterium]|nr:type II secretion system protein GspJ [Verrucomicrobiae bacterium]